MRVTYIDANHSIIVRRIIEDPCILIAASLRLKNEIGERQDSLRRLSRAYAGMRVADTQTGRTHLASFH